MHFINFDKLHHAYCLEGDLSNLKTNLFEAFEKIGINTTGNPNLLSESFKTLGINEAKQIIDFQTKKAFGGEKKLIILEIENITVEAQNTLLKTIEEPTGDTHFFLIVTSSEIFLPTLRSRLQIQKYDAGKPDKDLSEHFIKSPKSERLNIIKKITEEKDRVGAINLLNGIESTFYNKIRIERAQRETQSFLETINKFRGYLGDRSPNIKGLLEHIALITPKI